MRIRYNTLFRIKLTASYYTDNDVCDDLMIEPTAGCRRLLSKYKLLSKINSDGINILYRTDIPPASIAPLYPIPQVEKFYFTIKVKKEDFWFYADAKDWKSDKIYLLKNPSFNTTAPVVMIHNAALANPIRFLPMSFRYEVDLQVASGLLQIRDTAGVVLKQQVVRPKTVSEPVGKLESILLDLEGYPEGQYQLHYIKTGGPITENVFCSPSFSPDTLCVVEMAYRTGAWTGFNPIQQYKISVNSRATDWFYDIYIRNNTILWLGANQLFVNHIPAGEPPVVLNVVGGSIPITNDFVQFKSAAPIPYRKKPMQLQLKSVLPALTLVDALPQPSITAVQVDGVGNLFTKVIINV